MISIATSLFPSLLFSGGIVCIGAMRILNQMSKSSSSSKTSLSKLRVEYSTKSLVREDLGSDPIALFEEWLGEAREVGELEPNAMCLSTVRKIIHLFLLSQNLIIKMPLKYGKMNR